MFFSALNNGNIDGLAQDYSNFIVNELELL